MPLQFSPPGHRLWRGIPTALLRSVTYLHASFGNVYPPVDFTTEGLLPNALSTILIKSQLDTLTLSISLAQYRIRHLLNEPWMELWRFDVAIRDRVAVWGGVGMSKMRKRR